MASPNVTRSERQPELQRKGRGHGALRLQSAFESVRVSLSFLRAYVSARTNLISADERGEIASWVVVTALVVAAAIVIVGIITAKLTNTANNIQTP